MELGVFKRDGDGVIFTKHNFENPVAEIVARLIGSLFKKQMSAKIKNWRNAAKKYGLSRQEQELKARAFRGALEG